MAISGPQKFPGASTDHFFQGRFAGSPIESSVIVWHSTETTVLPGYQGGASAPNLTAVPDFAKKRIVWHQHFDFDVSARALLNPPGGVETNRRGVTQVEVVGTCDPALHRKLVKSKTPHLFLPELPDWAIRDLAKLARWARDNHNVPLTSSVQWKAFPSSFGLKNGVRIPASSWNGFKGHCGHQHVPENDHGDPGNMPIAAILKAAGSAKVPAAVTLLGATKIHVVKPKETLFGIAHGHGLTLAQLLAANPAIKKIKPKDLQIGTKLKIPW